MTAVRIIAAREIRDGLRNRWVAATILLLTTIALALYFLGTSPGGSVRASVLDVTVVSLASLSVYLIPLIALMLAFDALVGEFERGTMLLLLTYPVARWQVVMGKFAGHAVILLVAILAGYGGTALVIVISSDSGSESWPAYLLMMASSWMLGMIFIAIGYLVSVIVRERATAVGAAIGVWLIGVVLYDLGLMGLLLVDEEQSLGQNLFTTLLVANPTDAYRIFNLTGFDSIRQVAGMTDIGAGVTISPVISLSTMTIWLLTPLAITIWWFGKREL